MNRAARLFFMIVLLAIFSLLPAGIIAEDENTQIAETLSLTPVTKLVADDVDYDCKRMILAGSVFLDHAFGTIACDKAVLIFAQEQENGTDQAVAAMPTGGFSPKILELHGNVFIALKDGTTLSSDDAEIQCATMEGVFTSNKPNKVYYTTSVQEGTAASKLRAESQAIRLKMTKVGGDNPQYAFTDMQSEGAMNIEYEIQKAKS